MVAGSDRPCERRIGCQHPAGRRKPPALIAWATHSDRYDAHKPGYAPVAAPVSLSAGLHAATGTHRRARRTLGGAGASPRPPGRHDAVYRLSARRGPPRRAASRLLPPTGLHTVSVEAAISPARRSRPFADSARQLGVACHRFRENHHRSPLPGSPRQRCRRSPAVHTRDRGTSARTTPRLHHPPAPRPPLLPGTRVTSLVRLHSPRGRRRPCPRTRTVPSPDGEIGNPRQRGPCPSITA